MCYKYECYAQLPLLETNMQLIANNILEHYFIKQNYIIHVFSVYKKTNIKKTFFNIVKYCVFRNVLKGLSTLNKQNFSGNYKGSLCTPTFHIYLIQNSEISLICQRCYLLRHGSDLILFAVNILALKFRVHTVTGDKIY